MGPTHTWARRPKQAQRGSYNPAENNTLTVQIFLGFSFCLSVHNVILENIVTFKKKMLLLFSSKSGHGQFQKEVVMDYEEQLFLSSTRIRYCAQSFNPNHTEVQSKDGIIRES
jgi:hypothetical protein